MELTSTAYEVGGVGISPGTAASPDVTEAELHGGAFISPHGGVFVSPGAVGGASTSPAKAATARTDIKVKERASLFSFVMFSPLVNRCCEFCKRSSRSVFQTADWLCLQSKWATCFAAQ